MILVTLGTQDKSFVRLLEAIDKQIELGNIKDKVIVQAGYTKYNSPNMETFNLIDSDKFNMLIKECDLLITHGGVGSILAGLKHQKKIIVAPRLKQYNEHTNNHQLQIIDEFTKRHFILPLLDFDKLDKVLKDADSFVPNRYESNTNNIIKLIEDYINNK